MGLIFDKINAEVAAREGLIAAAGVGRLHLLPMRDRSLVEKRTRNIRAIRNDAAAKLGVLPSQTIQADPDGRGLRDFRIDFHRKGGAIDPRGRYSIFATATDLSSEKRYVVGNAEHERLRLNAAPTGRRTANVVDTDDLGEPVYEVVEDPRAALLSHLTAQVVRHIKPVIVGSAEAKALGVVEWGSTVDTVYFPEPTFYTRDVVAGETWATLRAGASATNGAPFIPGLLSVSTTNKWRKINRCPVTADLTAYSAPDSSALVIYVNSVLNTLGLDPVIHITPTTAPATPGTPAAGDGDVTNYTMTSKGSFTGSALTTGQYNTVAITDQSFLNFGGIARLAMVHDSDLNNVAPTWASSAWSAVSIQTASAAGTDQDPYLELTTAAAAASGGMGTTMKMLLGLR